MSGGSFLERGVLNLRLFIDPYTAEGGASFQYPLACGGLTVVGAALAAGAAARTAAQAGGASTPIASGLSRAAKRGPPNSIYEQMDQQSGSVRSRTFYDENGNAFSRQDFDHSHGEMQPHEHQRGFNAQGQPITPEAVGPVLPGFNSTLTPP